MGIINYLGHMNNKVLIKLETKMKIFFPLIYSENHLSDSFRLKIWS